jgi:hypothetical protein
VHWPYLCAHGADRPDFSPSGASDVERRRDAVTQARRRVSCPRDRGPPAALAAVAVYVDGADLRLDVVMLPFVSGADPAALKELAAFGEACGGPERAGEPALQVRREPRGVVSRRRAVAPAAPGRSARRELRGAPGTPAGDEAAGEGAA